MLPPPPKNKAIGPLREATAGPNDIRYVYDELSRLIGVIDLNGQTARYRYDAVGTYTTFVDPTNGATGAITFTLSTDLNGGSVMVDGPSKAMTVTRFGQNGVLTFTGTAGQRVGMGIASKIAGRATITAPNGTLLLSGTSSNFSALNTNEYDLSALSGSGTYTIFVDPTNGTTGAITFTLSTDVITTVVVNVTAVPITVTRFGQNGRGTFTGSSGQKLTLGLTSNTFAGTTSIVIFKPDGSSHASTNTSAANSTYSVPTLTVSGVFTIFVDPASGNTGNIRLQLTQTSALLANAVQTGQIDSVATAPTTDPGLPMDTTPIYYDGQDVLMRFAVNKMYLPGVLHDVSINPVDADQAGGAFDDEDAALDLLETSPNEAEQWQPDAPVLRGGQWVTRRPLAHAAADMTSRAKLMAEAASDIAAGDTALAGRVLKLNGRPMPRVTLRIKDQVTTTDGQGRFVLTGLSAGHHKLVIDGSSANTRKRSYGYFEAGVDLVNGEVNTLPFDIWMTALDTQHTLKLSYPIVAATVLTTPLIPGLEIRLAAGSEIRDVNGKLVTELGITPIPLDRTPFPLPSNQKDVPVFFTVQPGGAKVWPAAQVVYPNYRGLSPGLRADFWHYDPEEEGWYVYGQGTVNNAATQVLPDIGVGIYEFTGAMFDPCTSCEPEEPRRPPFPRTDSGDPVDLATGLFDLSATDISLPGVMPIEVSRMYRQNDPYTRTFGIGANSPYEMRLWSANLYQEIYLILADGGEVRFTRTSAGTDWVNAIFEHVETPGRYYKTRIYWNGNGWDMALTDGTVYSFGDVGPLYAIRDRNGNAIRISRAAQNFAGAAVGDMTRVQSSDGRWIAFTYDTQHRMTGAQDNLGRTVGYQYDGGGRLWKVTDPDNKVTEYTYDANARMTNVKDRRGISFITNLYDTNNRVISQTLISGGTYLFTYTAVNSITLATQADVQDPTGNVRRVTFNSAGFITSDQYPLGKPEQQTVTYTRQLTGGQIIGNTDPLGRQAKMMYDGFGNLTQQVQFSGTAQALTTTMTYTQVNGAWLVKTQTDPLGRVTAMDYDAKGNVISNTNAYGQVTRYSYNTVGQVISTTNVFSLVTQMAYEGQDLVSVTDPLGGVSRRFRDAAGQMVWSRDSLAAVTTMAYTPLGLVVRMTDTLGNSTGYGYDANLNRISLTDARGNTTLFGYDGMDQAVTTTNALAQTARYFYNGMSQPTQMVDQRGLTTTLSYDASGRLRTKQHADGSVITFTYSPIGNLVNLQDSTNGTLTRTYDTRDLMTSESTTLGTVSYGYDLYGRVISKAVTGQTTISYTYDALSRLASMVQGASVVGYFYDSFSRPISMSLPLSFTVHYGYDAVSRQTSMTYKRNGVQYADLGYAFDLLCRRVRMTGSLARVGLPQAITSATYDAANQLTNWNGTTLTYDANGNLTNDGSSTFTWNARNQLASMSGGATASFGYDAMSRRAQKTIAGVTTQFVYDGENPIKEIKGAQSASLLAGGTDQFFSRTDASGERTLLVDMLGSVLAQVDSAGNTTTSYTYDAYGGTSVSGAASDSSYQYTSRENDGTGLYFYRARYYSPKLARFISRDPIGFRAGPNFYAYVNGDPISKTDPMGLSGAAVGAIPSPVTCYTDAFGQIHCEFNLPDIKWPEWPQQKTKTDDAQSGSGRRKGFPGSGRYKTVGECWRKRCLAPCAACLVGVIDEASDAAQDTANASSVLEIITSATKRLWETYANNDQVTRQSCNLCIICSLSCLTTKSHSS